VKLFDIGPPKAVLRLALQPPDTDDIERTVLLLKQVGGWLGWEAKYCYSLPGGPLECPWSLMGGGRLFTKVPYNAALPHG